MANDSKPSLGSIVRHLRTANKWTLAEMSSRVAIPLSTLAKVERDQLTLSYEKLVDLSDRLGMRLADFLNATPNATQPKGMARRSVGKRSDGLKVDTRNYDYRYLCTELRGKIMIPIVTRMRSKSIEEFGELIRHAGEEFIYVLEGAIEVHSEFYDPITLHVGDHIYLDSEMGHGYIVTGGFEEATVLGVCASAAENLQQDLISQSMAEAGQHATQPKPAAPAKIPKSPERTEKHAVNAAKRRKRSS